MAQRVEQGTGRRAHALIIESFDGIPVTVTLWPASRSVWRPGGPRRRTLGPGGRAAGPTDPVEVAAPRVTRAEDGFVLGAADRAGRRGRSTGQRRADDLIVSVGVTGGSCAAVGAAACVVEGASVGGGMLTVRFCVKDGGVAHGR